MYKIHKLAKKNKKKALKQVMETVQDLKNEM